MHRYSNIGQRKPILQHQANLSLSDEYDRAKWHVRSYTTFSKHDVFKGLGNAIPEAMDKDMRTPPADSIISLAMTDIKDTQLSTIVDATMFPLPGFKSETKGENAGIPPVHDTAVSVVESDAKIQKDLPANQGASPDKLEDLVTPIPILGDELPGPPIPASCMEKEKQEYPWWVKVHSP